jgi:signal transduction histidine kinase
MSRMIRSSAVTLALGYSLLGFAALILFAFPLWYAWQGTIREGRAEILLADAQRLTEIYRRDGADALKTYIDARVQMQIAGERILLLTDAALRPVAGNLAAWPRTVPVAPGDYHIQVDMGTPGGVLPAFVHVAMLGRHNLLVGRDNRLFAPLEKRFWYGLTGAIAVLSIAGVLIGLITRRALMSRVHSIQQTISAIMHGDLKHRLPTHLTEDELNTLSRTINGMLDQIELLVHGVKNVSNSIAHDLRTPLAELRSRLEELSLIRPPAAVTFDEIDGAVADVDRVIRIFDALLRLAEIDAGMRRSGFVPVDVADLAATAVEFYAPAAELKNIALTLHANGPLPVSGDPVLLAQALSNLIDNALKFAPESGAIDVAVQRRDDGAVEIAVMDDGPGITDAEKDKVMQRFYRGDASRGTPGVGLGLSLVQAVAKLHGNSLELTDRKPGLRVVLAVPAALLN